MYEIKTENTKHKDMFNNLLQINDIIVIVKLEKNGWTSRQSIYKAKICRFSDKSVFYNKVFSDNSVSETVDWISPGKIIKLGIIC